MKNLVRFKKGLTLLEMIFTLALISLLISSLIFLYTVVLRSSTQIGKSSDLEEKLSFGLEQIVRDVRNANAVKAHVTYRTLRFTLGSQSYIYYLYNVNDAWPPNYNQSAYELRKAPVSGGIDGSFTYGAGDLIVTGLKPPNETRFEQSSVTNVFTAILTGLDNEETYTVRGNIRPRNVIT